MLKEVTGDVRKAILHGDAPFLLTLSAPLYRKNVQTQKALEARNTFLKWLDLPEAPRKVRLYYALQKAQQQADSVVMGECSSESSHTNNSGYRLSLECFTQKQHFTAHVNLERAGTIENLLDDLFGLPFLQAHLQTPDGDTTIHLHPRPAGQPPKAVVKRGKASRSQWNLDAQQDKQYPITTENARELLMTLGIADERGRIIDNRRSKFKQINQFISLAMTLDLFKESKAAALRIIDCGCGKAYLSLALYWYLNKVRGIELELTGIDSNPRVINFANEAAGKLKLGGASFVHATITAAALAPECDLLIALHACDTATDEALARAINLKAKAILAAPCCHHYVNERLRRTDAPDDIEALLRDNISRERLADLLTDSMRRDILQTKGYRAGLIEFVAPEHTSKNIMIRAEYTGTASKEDDLRTNFERWGVAPYLLELLKH